MKGDVLNKGAMAYPKTFYASLLLYHTFPLHSPLTTFVLDAPFGRFAQSDGKWNIDGNIGWFVMEIVAPITFLTTIASANTPSLSVPTKVAASLYVIHYAIRAVISPLVLAPKRSPQNVIVAISAAFFNLLNASLLGTYIAGNPLRESDWYNPRFWLGIAGWAIGLLGNIYHDEILHDLRRPSVLFRLLGIQSRFVEDKKKTDGKVDKYKIPKGGLFHWIAFPNYTCEWFEWLSYSLMLSPWPLLAVSPTVFHDLPLPAAIKPFLPSHLLTPPWAFLLAEVTSMLPRAWRGVQWYRRKFGKEWDQSGRAGGRWVVLPGVV